MTCDKPKPQWGSAFGRPVSVIGCGVGSALLVCAVFMDWPTRWLAYPGCVLFFAGLTTAVLRAYGFTSMRGLLGGERGRSEVLTAACDVELRHMRFLAEQLCNSPATVRIAIKAATKTACRSWVTGNAAAFRIFLFCQIVSCVRRHPELSADHRDPVEDANIYLVLYRVCRVPAAAIARMLDQDLQTVRDRLLVAPTEHGHA
jgi:hypothetical protein